MSGHPQRRHEICLFSLVGGGVSWSSPVPPEVLQQGLISGGQAPPGGYLLSALREARRLGHRAAGALATTQAPT